MSPLNTEALLLAYFIHIANIKNCDLVEFFLDSKIASKNQIRLIHIHGRFIKDKWNIKSLEVIFYIIGKLNHKLNVCTDEPHLSKQYQVLFNFPELDGFIRTQWVSLVIFYIPCMSDICFIRIGSPYKHKAKHILILRRRDGLAIPIFSSEKVYLLVSVITYLGRKISLRSRFTIKTSDYFLNTFKCM